MQAQPSPRSCIAFYILTIMLITINSIEIINLAPKQVPKRNLFYSDFGLTTSVIVVRIVVLWTHIELGQLFRAYADILGLLNSPTTI